MRVLVITTAVAWTARVRLLGTLAAALADRGDVVAIVCARGSAVERAIAERWPRLSVRPLSSTGRIGRFTELRALASALRPDAVLVGTAGDARLAALATNRQVRVVRRMAVEEREAPGRRPSARGRRIDLWGAEALAVGWPAPSEPSTTAAGPRHSRIGTRAPELLIVVGARHDEAAASALRAAATLRARHPTLRVTLAGEHTLPQETRVHAASLGLTPALELIALDGLVAYRRPSPTVVWCAADDDAGAIGALAASQQYVPVVVAFDAPYAQLVAPAITGFHWRADAASLVVSEVARLLGDDEARHTMGEAAGARAAREFGWDAFVLAAAQRLSTATPRFR